MVLKSAGLSFSSYRDGASMPRGTWNEVRQTSKGFPWRREASAPVYYTDDAVVVDYAVFFTEAAMLEKESVRRAK